MLVKAKSTTATATNSAAALPTSVSSALWVSSIPVSPQSNTPLHRIMNAVAVHTSNVSTYTPSVCTNPCFTGWLTSAVAAALGVDPSPASLLKRPRFTPITTAMPIPPPTAGPMPNALSSIRRITCGNMWARVATT